MVRVVGPPLLLLPPPPPLSSPPQAATPRARAVKRQPEAATERTRKGPSSGTRYRRRWILGGRQDAAQCPMRRASLTLNEFTRLRRARDGARTGAQDRRLPGRYGVSIRTVTATSAISTVIMKASNALAPMAQRTSQMIRPKVVARTTPMARKPSGRRGGAVRRGPCLDGRPQRRVRALGPSRPQR